MISLNTQSFFSAEDDLEIYSKICLVIDLETRLFAVDKLTRKMNPEFLNITTSLRRRLLDESN